MNNIIFFSPGLNGSFLNVESAKTWKIKKSKGKIETKNNLTDTCYNFDKSIIKNFDKSFANFNLVDKIISNFVTYKARQWWDLGPIKIMKSIWTIETDKAGWLATGGMARGKKNI